MSKNKVNASALSIEDIEKGVDRNRAIIKNLFIFYAVALPICLATTILMFVVGNGQYFRYGYTLAIMCVLCTVYVVMAYVRRKRILNEFIKQQNKKKKK